MPIQTFRWEDTSLPVVGHTASVGYHGICCGTPFTGAALHATGVVRSWRRRRPRSSIILVELEVPVLVEIPPEDLHLIAEIPPSPKAKIVAPARPAVIGPSVWTLIRRPWSEPDRDEEVHGCAR